MQRCSDQCQSHNLQSAPSSLPLVRVGGARIFVMRNSLNPPTHPVPCSHQTYIFSVCAPAQLSAADQQEFDRGMCSLGPITARRFNSVLADGLEFSKSFFILFKLLFKRKTC